MNDLILRELRKVKVAQIEPFDENSTTIHIKKGLNVNEFKVGKGYEIELDDVLVFPPMNFSFHINWNKGIKPTSKYLKCFIIERVASTIKVDAVACDENFNDTSDIWSGWLPIEYLKIRGEL